MDENEKWLEKYNKKEQKKLDTVIGKKVKRIHKTEHGSYTEFTAFERIHIIFDDNTELILESSKPDIDYSTSIYATIKKPKALKPAKDKTTSK